MMGERCEEGIEEVEETLEWWQHILDDLSIGTENLTVIMSRVMAERTRDALKRIVEDGEQ